jgi:hypothetical protein
MKFILVLMFSPFCFQGNCQYKIINDSSRRKGIELYNEFVRQDTMYKQIEDNHGDDSITYWHYNSQNEITSILVRKKVSDKFYIETNYWFLQNQLLHIFITYIRKNWLKKWKDNRFGWYTFNNNILLDFHERKIPRQNLGSLIEQSTYYLQIGVNRLNIQH